MLSVKYSILRRKLTYSQVLLIFTVFTGTFSNSVYAQQEVSFQVQGIIKPHCGFEQSPVASGQLNSDVVFSIDPDDANWGPQSGKIALALSCNAPFTLAVRSHHGGLINQSPDAKNLGGKFTSEIGYNLALSITTEDAALPLVLACQSHEMVSSRGNCSASSGTNAAIGYGAGIGDVAVSLFGSSRFPIRGRYQDTIVLAVAFQ
jgi:hypothetical protein